MLYYKRDATLFKAHLFQLHHSWVALALAGRKCSHSRLKERKKKATESNRSQALQYEIILASEQTILYCKRQTCEGLETRLTESKVSSLTHYTMTKT